MRTPLTPAVLVATLASAALLGGCNGLNSLYKKDTGTIEPVAAPNSNYTPIEFADVNAGNGGDGSSDDSGLSGDAGFDPDAAPEVLAGEGPDAIQPLDEDVTPEPEVMETYVVVKGDTLGHISQKMYGTIGRTKDLINANPGINPNRMQIGDVINVPR